MPLWCQITDEIRCPKSGARTGILRGNPGIVIPLPAAKEGSNDAKTGGSAASMSLEQLEKRAVGIIDELLRVGLVEESFLTV